MLKHELEGNELLQHCVNVYGIGFNGLEYHFHHLFGDNFNYGCATQINPNYPLIDYFVHDLAHIVEYTIDEFSKRTMKTGGLSFTTPWNDYFNCSDGFSKLSASLREARTIAIELHLLEIANIKFNINEYIVTSADSVVMYVDDSLYLSIKNCKSGFKETHNMRVAKISSLIYRYYTSYNKESILTKLRDRMKAISLYANNKTDLIS